MPFRRLNDREGLALSLYFLGFIAGACGRAARFSAASR